jgi:3-phytase
VETDPVLSADDAADDPAIFVNSENPSQSFIIGTDKEASLELYYLKGMRRAVFENGDMNNVDIRYGFPLLDGRRINIVGATDRYSFSIKLFTFDPSTQMLNRIDNRKKRLISTTHEVYGFCLYNDLENDEFYAFVTTITGDVQQWKLTANQDDKVDGELIRLIDLSSQTEGCVADDELGYVYIGEEEFGIWKFPARPDGGSEGTVVDDINNPNLKADIEGLTIYYAADGRGYLIASSQGNSSYAVYEREGDNEYIGSFTIDDLVVEGEVEIDGTSGTDGIDVTNRSLGKDFPFGVFVAQDDVNEGRGDSLNQNFKLVSWDKIANLFEPPLIIDTTYVVGQGR